MAMVWIEKIIHCSPVTGQVVLQQNDPTYHPVMDGRQYNNVPMYINNGQTWDASWFVIPWANSGGKLLMSYLGKSVSYTVGPISPTSDDYLRADDALTGVRISEVEIGPRGGNGICSVSLHLLITEKEVEFQFWDSSGTGPINGQQILDNLLRLAEVVAKFVGGKE